MKSQTGTWLAELYSQSDTYIQASSMLRVQCLKLGGVPCDSPHAHRTDSKSPALHGFREPGLRQSWGLDQSIPLQQHAQGEGCWGGRAPASQSPTGCLPERLHRSCHFLRQGRDPEIQVVVLPGHKDRRCRITQWKICCFHPDLLSC